LIRTSSLGVPYQVSFANELHAGVADVPIEKGGSGNGFGPHDLLEAALATCLTMTVQMSADKHGIPLTAARCEVRIDRSILDAAVLHYTLFLDGPLTEDQSGRLREAASRCPVVRTLTGAIAVVSDVVP